jgi:stress-induced-phosphoprotein 1
MERPEGSGDVPEGYERMPSSEASSSKPAASSTPSTKPTPAAKEQFKAEEPMEVDTPEDAGAQKEAEALKAKGNASYKARRFDEAVEAYSKAWEVYPKDVTFLTNLSGELDEPIQKNDGADGS